MSRNRVTTVLILGGALLLALAVSTASAQTIANGPYYATPSWDRKCQCPHDSSFANWNSDAVLDRETGRLFRILRASLTRRTPTPRCPLATMHSTFYWSATTFAGITDSPIAWGASFGSGDLDSNGKLFGLSPAWCVRGGGGPRVDLQ